MNSNHIITKLWNSIRITYILNHFIHNKTEMKYKFKLLKLRFELLPTSHYGCWQLELLKTLLYNKRDFFSSIGIKKNCHQKLRPSWSPSAVWTTKSVIIPLPKIPWTFLRSGFPCTRSYWSNIHVLQIHRSLFTVQITSNNVGKRVCIVSSKRPIIPVTACGLQVK